MRTVEKTTSNFRNKNVGFSPVRAEEQITDVMSRTRLYAENLESILGLFPPAWQRSFDEARFDMDVCDRLLCRGYMFLLEKDLTSRAWKGAAMLTMERARDLSRSTRYCRALLHSICEEKTSPVLRNPEVTIAESDGRFAIGLRAGLEMFELYFDNEQLSDNPAARQYLELLIIQHNNGVSSRTDKILRFGHIANIPIPSVYVLISAYSKKLGKLRGQVSSIIFADSL